MDVKFIPQTESWTVVVPLEDSWHVSDDKWDMLGDKRKALVFGQAHFSSGSCFLNGMYCRQGGLLHEDMMGEFTDVAGWLFNFFILWNERFTSLTKVLYIYDHVLFRECFVLITRVGTSCERESLPVF